MGEIIVSLPRRMLMPFAPAIEQANVDRGQDTITFAPALSGTIIVAASGWRSENGRPGLSRCRNLSFAPGAYELLAPSQQPRYRDASRTTPPRSTLHATPRLRRARPRDHDHHRGHDRHLRPRAAGSSTPRPKPQKTTIIDNTAVSAGLGNGIGGGIDNTGTLTVLNTVISDNDNAGGALGNANGGGIYSTGSLSVQNATISGNSAILGAGIYNAGTASVVNTTISGNSGAGSRVAFGGGIYNAGKLTLEDSTVSGNSTVSDFKLGSGDPRRRPSGSRRSARSAEDRQTGSAPKSGNVFLTYSTRQSRPGHRSSRLHRLDPESRVHRHATPSSKPKAAMYADVDVRRAIRPWAIILFLRQSRFHRPFH